MKWPEKGHHESTVKTIGMGLMYSSILQINRVVAMLGTGLRND